MDMKDKGYFDTENYTGNHLHIDNFKDQFTPYLEAIALERNDQTLDLFFNDFENKQEYTTIFENTEHYYNDYFGLFLGNIKIEHEVYSMFHNWINTVLLPYRKKEMAHKATTGDTEQWKIVRFILGLIVLFIVAVIIEKVFPKEK